MKTSQSLALPANQETAMPPAHLGSHGAEFMLHAILDKSPAAIYCCDRDGLITYYNANAADAWGRSPKLNDPVDRFCGAFRLFAPDGSPVTHDQCWMALALRENKPYLGQEIEIERPDGTRLSVLAHANPIHDDAGELIGAVNIVVDITERKRLSEQLRQSQKMEAIGQLAGGIAHDFNNLLCIINGYSEMVAQQLPEENPHRSLLLEVKKAGERAASLTHQLLAFSRKQVLAPEILDLNALVADTERMLRRLIGEDIDLVAVMAPNLHTVKADPGQIEQIMLNLAINARDAMPRGGKLTIETANVKLDESYAVVRGEVKPGAYVMLAMTDNGYGMDKATQARIFEPFFTTKKPGKGTGLGLATGYGIVKQSGGFIYVYSEPGHGTTFKVYLPRAEKPTATEKPSTLSSPGLLGGQTILLVEDDVNVRAVARHSLQACGYSVLEASSGEDALSILQHTPEPIHLVISD